MAESKNKPNTRSRGARYEQIAADFLTKAGYQIVTINYQSGKLEIDIICSKNRELIFVEVKGGKSMAFGDPVFRVDKRKQGRIIKTAHVYLQECRVDYESYRFDVIVISDLPGGLTINHICSAFTL